MIDGPLLSDRVVAAGAQYLRRFKQFPPLPKSGIPDDEWAAAIEAAIAAGKPLPEPPPEVDEPKT